MRSSISLSLLVAFHSLVAITKAAPQLIQQRSPYSVVPVDGGAAAAAQTGGSPPPATIILTETETITEKSPAATITIVEHQPKSKTLEITETVTVTAPAPPLGNGGPDGEEEDGKKEVETVYVTVTEEHVPTAMNTEAGGPLIYVPTTVVETHFVTLPRETVWLVASMTAMSDASFSSTSRSFSSSSTLSTTASLASSTNITSSSIVSFSTQTTATTDYTSTSTTASSIEESSFTSSSESLITTLQPYDSGQGRTTYPVWSNSTPTNAPRSFNP